MSIILYLLTGFMIGLAVRALILEYKVFKRRFVLGHVESEIPLMLVLFSYTFLPIVALLLSFVTHVVAEPDTEWAWFCVQAAVSVAALVVSYWDTNKTRTLKSVVRSPETQSTDA